MDRNKSRLTERAFLLHKKEASYKTADSLDFIITVILVILAVFAIRAFIFEPVMVEGDSMNPTLINKERMFVEKFTYWFDNPKRGDIVICHYPPTYARYDKTRNQNTTYVKRVIGLPGETIKIDDGKVYIKSEITGKFVELNESYIDVYTTMEMEYTIPKDSIFVMGDNRQNSADSRQENIGAIKLTAVVGRAYGVIYPIDSFRKLDEVSYEN